MDFKGIYNLVEKIKKGLKKTGSVLGDILYFLLDGGLQALFYIGIVVVIFLVIFRDVLGIALLVVAAIIAGYIAFLKLKKKYTTKKEAMFQEEIFNVMEKNFKEFEGEIQLITDPLKYNSETREFDLKHNVQLLPMSEHEEFYSKALEKVSYLLNEVEEQYFPDYYFNNFKNGFYPLVSDRFKLGIDMEKYKSLINLHYDFENLIVDTHQELERLLRIAQSGNEGEKRMKYALNLLKNQEDIIVLENILLKHNNKTFETDFLVFSKYGVFSLEVKNIGSSGKFSIKITRDGQWLKIFNDGTATPMPDVSSQSNYHVSLTEGLFKQFETESGITAPKVYPSIIIANNEVMINNEANLPISPVSKFATDLTEKEAKYSMGDMKKLAEWVASKQLEDKKFEVSECSESLKQIFNQIKELDRQVDRIDHLSSQIQYQLRGSNPELLDLFIKNMSNSDE